MLCVVLPVRITEKYTRTIYEYYNGRYCEITVLFMGTNFLGLGKNYKFVDSKIHGSDNSII